MWSRLPIASSVKPSPILIWKIHRLQRIVEKGILAAKARVAAKRAREVTHVKNGLEISNLSGIN